MAVLLRVIFPALALAASWLFTGCTTVGPDFRPEIINAPALWSQRHGGDPALAAPEAAVFPVHGNRWSVFADRELDRLLALATEANQDVKTASLRVLQARVDETTVSAQRGIQASARSSVVRQRQSEYGTSSRVAENIGGAGAPSLIGALSAPFTLYQAGFDASWEPDLWGRVLRAEESAKASTESQQAALRQVLLGVRAEVARSYFALRSAQRRSVLVKDELAGAHETAALLSAQRDSGLIDESALIRQRSQVAALEALLPSLLMQEAQAMNQITLLCGVDPGGIRVDLVDRATGKVAGDTPAGLPDLRLGLPADFTRRRPDIAVAEARLHAATANIGIAVADLYPRVTLGAGFGLESAGSSRFGDWGGRQWSIGPSLSVPVFDRGRRRATIYLRELQQQEAAVAFQQTVLKAWHDVDDAISTFVTEARRGVRFADRVRIADEELRLAKSRFSNGLTTYLPVLSAHAEWIQFQRDDAESTARTHTALAALYKALGEDSAPP